MLGSARLELSANGDGLRGARLFVTDHLHAWGYSSVAPEAALLTSELVTNAMRHASPPYAVEVVDLQDGVLVTVEDTGHDLPAPRHAEPDAVDGRGLAIVESMAAEWGSRPISDRAKAVWFRLVAQHT